MHGLNQIKNSCDITYKFIYIILFFFCNNYSKVETIHEITVLKVLFLNNFSFLDLDGKPEFSPGMRNNSMSDEIAELEHELELQLEHELEVELKLEQQLAELAGKFFNKTFCVFKLLKELSIFNRYGEHTRTQTLWCGPEEWRYVPI